MHREGHTGLALVVYAPAAFVLANLDLYVLLVFGGVATIFASDVPDWDLQMSRVPHRGPTHTLWFVPVVGLGTAAVAVAATVYGAPRMARLLLGGPLLIVDQPQLALAGSAAFGFTAGVLGAGSHLLGDLLTPMGVPLLRPWRDTRYSLNVTKAANRTANRLLGLAGSAAFTATIYAAARLDVLT